MTINAIALFYDGGEVSFVELFPLSLHVKFHVKFHLWIYYHIDCMNSLKIWHFLWNFVWNDRGEYHINEPSVPSYFSICDFVSAQSNCKAFKAATQYLRDAIWCLYEGNTSDALLYVCYLHQASTEWFLWKYLLYTGGNVCKGTKEIVKNWPQDEVIYTRVFTVRWIKKRVVRKISISIS